MRSQLTGAYLDYAATTPIAPEVLEAMLPYLGSEFGNASSQHLWGRRAHAAVEDARDVISRAIGADASELVFTSGSTESINLAIKGVVQRAPEHRRHVITAATEHKAVLDVGRALERDGCRLTVLPVDGRGLISLDALEASISDDTVLISLMAANNETGTLGQVREASKVAKSREVTFHSDATQLVGKLDADVTSLGVDLMSFSSHKLYGPKGVGALYVRRSLRETVKPQIDGGGHERGLRSGTLNVAGVVGFGAACKIALEFAIDDRNRIAMLRDRLEAEVLRIVPNAVVNGHRNGRLPNISNVTFPGVESDSLMLAMPDVAVSSGSACTAAAPSPSHVLIAMGLTYEAANESLRFSLGRYTTDADVAFALLRLAEAIELVGQPSAKGDPVGAPQ